MTEDTGDELWKTLDLPQRAPKPRSVGITATNDVGIPVVELEGILDEQAEFLDMAKLGVGTAYITPNLRRKLAIYREHGIPVYFGGTLFEKFYIQDKLDDYLRMLDRLDIGLIEVSHGSSSIPKERLLDVIQRVSSDFDVLAEVGNKKEDEEPDPSVWLDEVRCFLQADCQYVVLEGRSTGDVGLYNRRGHLRSDMVAKILLAAGPQKLIFEAPTLRTQVQLLNIIGSNANFGNVNVRELLVVEAQRRALKCETFFLK